ncbi:NACHT domain-containing protein [Streptosporangium sp. NBC_01756]|uniref:NACHT domain-containing protein n=1 Tax=Streptosporangium sp. NBC_01756 TaxID=2975950 RepID=UPI002DDA427E|nr:NACHT domain-containing protein [Streptosporangium sp. NBC_01756]WSC88240.1 NACHT domain-containing protein [Streptosporangium sp. NBC_01756]
MSGLEAVVAAAGKAVAGRALREGLAVRAAREERTADLATLIRSGFPDRFVRRSLERQLAAVADGVERRLAVLVEREYSGLTENDRAAVLHEVVAVLEAADLSDRAVLAADMDAIKLAKEIRSGLPDPARQLGEAGARLYDVLLDECLDCLVRILQQLPQYLPRAATEVLGRLSSVEERIAALGQQVSAALGRLPARSLDAPVGTQDDEEFERRYLEHLSRTLDEVELFGVRVENYRPRATLSVAYISLSVSTQGPARRRAPERMRLAGLTGPDAGETGVEYEPATLRVESALGRSRRTLLRGDAGSGKSTLLRWLSVTVARGGFSGDLAAWNGSVPFVVKLRSHPSGDLPDPEDFLADVAGPMAGRMPAGWVHRVLDAGRALLLVDGVDELAVRHRPAVRKWLGDLLAAYPGTRTVVTSRPAAADTRWLAEEDFSPVTLEPMTPTDLRELVRQWHAAMRGSPSLPCAPERLDEYEGALLARFESSPHLQMLASAPLLAAMLCALNLDRGKQLPRSRMGLYAAALELLLERRDAERGIAAEVALEPEQKVRVLQDLAWQLAVWGRSELSKATALKRVEEKIRTMPRVDATAEAVLDHLLQRSGVIREPAPGRVDFVHRTVQEYLAAKQAADDADMEPLVERAHLDQWRETVVMAAGHANAPVRRELLHGLLDRIDGGDRHGRKLRLLVAGCLETIQEFPRDLRDRVEGCLATVIPPRNMAEARVLALAGEEVLRRLPDDLGDLSEARAAATVRACWLINGAEALRKLAGYSRDPRLDVQRELVTGWEYFGRDEYATRVLADAPLPGGTLDVDNPRLLGGLRHLGHVRNLFVSCPVIGDVRFFRSAPPLRRLSLHHVGDADLADLGLLPELRWLYIQMTARRRADLGFLAHLPELRELSLGNVDFAGSLAFLDALPPLDSLALGEVDSVRDFGPIARHTTLRGLSLFGARHLKDAALLAGLPHLEQVTLSEVDIHGGLAALVEHSRGVRRLRLRDADRLDDLTPLDALDLTVLGLTRCPGATDLASLTRQRNLEALILQGSAVADLGPLSGLPKLSHLSLDGSRQVADLSPLADLDSLRLLYLLGTAPVLDLAPLAGKRRLQILADSHQELHNVHLLHPTTKVTRV